jgi:predicted nucleotidyltransferase
VKAAYGSPNKDSDIDIYIVMKDDADMREVDAMTEVDCGRIERRLRKPVDVLTLKKNRFLYRMGGRTLEKTVAEKGLKK